VSFQSVVAWAPSFRFCLYACKHLNFLLINNISKKLKKASRFERICFKIKQVRWGVLFVIKKGGYCRTNVTSKFFILSYEYSEIYTDTRCLPTVLVCWANTFTDKGIPLPLRGEKEDKKSFKALIVAGG